MKRQTYILIIAFLLALPACKVGKKYARPDLGLPSAIEEGAGAASIDSLSWRSLYTDTVLQRLISTALENNKDMLTAAAKIKEMAAEKRISFAGLFPEIDARLYGQKERLNYGGDNPTKTPEYGAKAVMSWEVDLWGNLRWADEAALADYMETVEARQALQLTIISEVATAYYELGSLKKELRIVQQTVDARQEGVRLAKLRFEGGLTSETSYRQAEIELSRTETLIPDLEKEINLKENDLAFLLGKYAGELPVGLTYGAQYLPDSLPVGLPSALLERRPDMRMAEHHLRAANARVGVAYTNLFPKITLTGNLGGESRELGDLLKSPAWFIAGELLTPLFDMGRNRASLKAERARYEQEVYQYQKNVLEAFREVNDALISLRKTKEVRASFARLEASAQTHSRLAYLQYINGITNYIDVLDAQRTLLDAQISLNDAELAEQLSIVDLYKALGGGY